MPDKTKMGELHVEHLAGLLHLRPTKGSGNQWTDPIDARSPQWALEGKSTLGQSIGFSRELIAKAREQASGERPLIGLRFYGNERLDRVDEDWVAMIADDLGELLGELDELRVHLLRSVEFKPEWTDEDIENFRQTFEEGMVSGEWAHPAVIPAAQPDEQELLNQLTEVRVELGQVRQERQELAVELGQARESLRAALTQVGVLTNERDQARQVAEQLAADVITRNQPLADGEAELAPDERGELIRLKDEVVRLQADAEFRARVITGLRDQLAGTGRRATLQAAMASPPPVLPWLSVFQTHSPGGSRHLGLHYDATGNMEPVPVMSVRVERSAANEPVLVVNDIRVRHGELFVDGVLLARVGEEAPAAAGPQGG
jgi:hypothetical protein